MSQHQRSQDQYQTPDVPAEILELVERAHWQSARTVEHVAPHQYNVLGWDKDDLTDEEFWKLAKAIKQNSMGFAGVLATGQAGALVTTLEQTWLSPAWRGGGVLARDVHASAP
jgi:hypothetical protein